MLNPKVNLFSRASRIFTLSLLVLLALQLAALNTYAQDTVTGAFDGSVKGPSGEPIPGATIQFINQLTGVPIAKRSDSQGRFYQGLLPPGMYTIRVSAPNFQPKDIELRLVATRSNSVIPVPVILSPVTTATTTTTTTTTQPTTTTTPSTQGGREERSILADINTTDARRGGSFTSQEVSTLPLGGRTFVRSFDELALLLPGVAAAPQAIGNGTGPGVGAGVGTSGQFSVNGLRSRANNFTVDGSDNNDEDIGVRRQGFFSLVPQPIESIEEFQIITLLAPAQYGRNLGAQVNAVSKSGGNETHGTIFGFVNSNQLNAPDAFDTSSGDTTFALQGRPLTQTPCAPPCVPVGTLGPLSNVFVDGVQKFVRNDAGEEDSFTLGHGGFVIGGPLIPNKLFYFISAEGQLLNATKEAHFAVPTIEQRGFANSGGSGLTLNPLDGTPIPGGEFPTTVGGDAIFSFFPFPNNPNGVYGRNTFTHAIPASAQGKVVSGKVDYHFELGGKRQDFTARYNFTSDWRDVPVTGGALFSRVRPRVRTQNFSTFLNSELSGANSTSPVFNQLRLSYGRTRLIFDEGRDQNSLRPVRRPFANPDDAQFLMNTQFLVNNTTPGLGAIFYDTFGTGETETQCVSVGCATLGPVGAIGQINVAGFSPVGVDVFNFPQRRVNNTYQLADTVTWRKGSHSFAFGADIRRTELISDLPRNSRPLLTFNGAPQIAFTMGGDPFFTGDVLTGADFAAAGAPSGVFQSLVLPGRDSHINLRYYQLNFFGQDEWRISPNFSLSFGLRYEYNTPPRDSDRRIENTFGAPLPPCDFFGTPSDCISGLAAFIDGRSRIFEPDRNNFAPRVGFAYSPNWFGDKKTTVIRAGYGLYYDQILGAVVSQSRNVFPTFTTINLGGGCCDITGTGVDEGFNIFNPLQTFIFGVPIIQPGTLNTLNPLLPQQFFMDIVYQNFPFIIGTPFGATLPAKNLKTPAAHQFSVTWEQQLSENMVVSAAYVGTRGRNLLRFTTPNLGPNYLVVPLSFNPGSSSFGGGTLSGVTLDPGFGRPNGAVGPINQFETNARSSYDALQLQMRGRFMQRFQYQVAYTFSRTKDDVSDVFDLAGSPALPQNSQTFAGEHGRSNFDAPHRFSYNFIYDFPEMSGSNSVLRFLFGGLQIASTGSFQSGQPFTVNSIFDVNLDGNLTDRPNSTSGIQETGDNAQPLTFTGNSLALLAPFGQDGSVPRNTFRAGNVLSLDLAVVKKFVVTERQSLTFRVDIFNFIDRTNYGIPVRYLEAPGFGRAVDTVTPGRRIQFGLKWTF